MLLTLADLFIYPRPPEDTSAALLNMSVRYTPLPQTDMADPEEGSKTGTSDDAELDRGGPPTPPSPTEAVAADNVVIERVALTEEDVGNLV